MNVCISVGLLENVCHISSCLHVCLAAYPSSCLYACATYACLQCGYGAGVVHLGDSSQLVVPQ